MESYPFKASFSILLHTKPDFSGTKLVGEGGQEVVLRGFALLNSAAVIGCVSECRCSGLNGARDLYSITEMLFSH